jgi:hypothetical protein
MDGLHATAICWLRQTGLLMVDPILSWRFSYFLSGLVFWALLFLVDLDIMISGLVLDPAGLQRFSDNLLKGNVNE